MSKKEAIKKSRSKGMRLEQVIRFEEYKDSQLQKETTLEVVGIFL